MSDNARRRLSIDLDEIERQLRQGGGQPQAGAPSQKADPLSELARIVGQDDPFGALLDEDQARRGRAPQTGQGSERHAPPAVEPDLYQDDVRAEYAAHGFDVDDPYAEDGAVREDYAEAAHDDGYAEDVYDDGYAPHDDAADWAGDGAVYEEEEAPRRGLGRKSLVTAGALVVVALVGVGSALWFAGSVEQDSDAPPLIAADSEPARVAPADPGGVEIPNQDTALLDARDGGESRVVDREEQPVDIAGLATEPVEPAREAPRVVLPSPGAAPAQPADRAEDPIGQAVAEDGLGALSNGLQPPLVTSPAVAALGEPRRVRTVTVRPDGTIVAPTGLQPATSAAAPAPETAPAPAPATEPIEPLATAPAAEPVPVAPAPDDLPSPAADDLPPPTQTAAAEPLPAPPVPPPAPTRSAPTQTAAAPQPAAPAPQPAAPLQLSALQNAAPAAPAAPVASGPTGGYAVQLAIRGSEDRARQAFDQLQAQYSAIIGDGQPIIRQAVVNGNTIFRVRVGAYSLERATQACDQIKAAGGDCFVAPNR
ncbi:SPOR domain-containing protein [Salinarimonas sp.]|uniref:SPOR domain-containing protein n=1 Tax=Salinarimonas sp. TaxID=2766526 RepID=UPI0032D8D3FD